MSTDSLTKSEFKKIRSLLQEKDIECVKIGIELLEGLIDSENFTKFRGVTCFPGVTCLNYNAPK